MSDWKKTLLSIRFAGRHHGIKIALLSMLVGVGCASVTLIYWIPSYLQHSSLEKEIDGQRKRIISGEYNKKISVHYSKSKKALRVLNKKLNAKHSQSEHVKQLDKMLRKRRIEVVNEIFDSEKLPGGFSRLTQELSLRGDYGDLRKFIIDLGKLPNWTMVQDLRIEKLYSYSSKIKVVLKMMTYYAEG